MTDNICIDGTVIAIRPIQRTDADRVTRMFARLSPRTVYFRFFSPIPSLSPSVLAWLTDVDHSRRDALVALADNEIVAVARYDASRGSSGSVARDAEFAVTVEDAWQHHGLGRHLTGRLAVLARDRGYDTFVARILPDNRPALVLMRRLAPDARLQFAHGDYEARFPLTDAVQPPIAQRDRQPLRPWEPIDMAATTRTRLDDQNQPRTSPRSMP